MQKQASLFWHHWRPCSQCWYLTVVLVETMALSHLSTVSKAVVLLEEDEGKKNKVPGKRAVAASVNRLFWARHNLHRSTA